MRCSCDHLALLVRELEPARERLGLPGGQPAEYPGEGTREVYLGPEQQPGRLLLMQPLGAAGPYARALRRRGPGLHHLALRTPDPSAWAASRAGWLLHPHSLQSLPGLGVVWLARPGVGLLIEVLPGEPDPAPPLLTRLEVPVADGCQELLGALGPLGLELVPVGAGAARLQVGGAGWALDDLLEPGGPPPPVVETPRQEDR